MKKNVHEDGGSYEGGGDEVRAPSMTHRLSDISYFRFAFLTKKS